MEQSKTIYRVAVSGLHCKSSVRLVDMKVSALDGVEAASVGHDGVLTIFCDGSAVTLGDIVRTLVDVGVTPSGAFEISEATTRAAEIAAEDSLAADAAELPQQELRLPEPSQVWAAEPVQDKSADRELAIVASAAVSEALAPHAAPHALFAVTEDVEAVSMPSIEAVIESEPDPTSRHASLVQRVAVEVSDNYYPSRIEVIPGVPVEIDFGEGHGCLARVLFEPFDIDEDLTQGGAIVRLPGLAPGEYDFSCGMHMVFGKVIAAA